MTKAFFLDRDGVINQERKDYVKTLEEFEILEGIGDAIKIIKNHSFLVIVITNQSAINRKLLSIEMLNKIHEKLKVYLKKNNTSIDKIYFCPHTPFENCECRKPKSGLIMQAINDFNIDISQSIMVGDSKTDIESAESAGCKGILLKENQSLLEIVHDLVESEKM